MKKQLKMAVVVALLAVGFTANAQTVDDATNNIAGKTDKASAAGKSIRLIDNKGTIKYMQSNNGITTITSKVAGNKTVTTWQLGGELKDNTYIAANTGKEFALDGLQLVGNLLTQTEFDAGITGGTLTDDEATRARVISGTATDRSVHYVGTAPLSNPNYGLTAIVRDETTGALKKIKLGDLLEVQSARIEKEVGSTTAGGTISEADLIDAAPTTPTGISLTMEAKLANVSVYRNGAKLRAGTDYRIKDIVTTIGSTSVTVTYVYLIPFNDGANDITTIPPGGTPVTEEIYELRDEWKIYSEDIIEVHVIK